MNNLAKDKLILDTTALADSDNVGAYLRAEDGTLVTHTTDGAKQRLDVANGAESLLGATLAGTERANISPVAVDPSNKLAMLKVNADGDLLVAATFNSAADKAEDAPSANGDIGVSVLSVRQDALSTTTSADGDYQPLKTDSLGRLWAVAQVAGDVADDAVDSGNPIKVGSRTESGPLSAVSNSGDRADLISDLYRRIYVNSSANIAIKAEAASVTDTAAVIATALGGRRTILVSNRGNKPIYIGAASVTAAAGFTVSAGSTISVDLGADVALYAIADTGQTVSCRVLQLA